MLCGTVIRSKGIIMGNDEMRQHLLNTTVMLLKEVYELDEITVRKIAEEAHVATGLINYHFKSKDALLVEAINKMIDESAKSPMNVLYDEQLSPKQRLRDFLCNLTDLMIEYKKYSQLTIRHEMLSERFNTPQFIEPFISMIDSSWSKAQVKYLAIQLIAPLQMIYLKQEAFYQYMGDYDVSHHAVIDHMLDNLGLLEKES